VRRARKRRQPRRLHIPIKLLIGLTISAGIWFAAEGILRKLGHPPAYTDNAVGRWRLQPNLENADWVGRARQHKFSLNSNDDGLRTTLTRARTPYSWRLAILGDSTALGWGVDVEDSLGEVIAGRLKETTSLHVEVLNAAQPGYSSWQAIWLYGEVVRHYRPDAVLLFLPLHDQNRVLVSDREYQEGAHGLTAKIRVWLATNSRIYADLRKLRYQRALDIQLPAAGMTRERRVERVPIADRIEALKRLQAINERNGVPVLLGLLPSYSDLGAPSQAQQGERIGIADVQDYATRNGIDMINVRSCCSGDPDPLVFSFDHSHYSVEGNRQIGEAIAAHLTAIGFPGQQFDAEPTPASAPNKADTKL
jgi:lysophospholipase L1-like esterase